MRHKLLMKGRALIYLIFVLAILACSNKPVAGRYVDADSEDYIDLKPNGTCSLRRDSKWVGPWTVTAASGSYEVNGDEVIISSDRKPKQVWMVFNLGGDSLTRSGERWVKRLETASSSSQRRTTADASIQRGGTTVHDESESLGILFGLLVFMLCYAWVAFCLQKIAQKLGHKDEAPWAWVPILNIFLLLKIAGWSAWSGVLLLIPIVNVFVLMAAWASVCDLLYKSRAIALGMIIPGVNLICLGYLAFSKTEETVNLSMTAKSEGTNQPEALEVEEHVLVVRDPGRTLRCRFCGYQFAAHEEMATRCPECRSTAKQAQQENSSLERKHTPATSENMKVCAPW